MSVQSILEQMSLVDKGKGEERGNVRGSPLHCSDDGAMRKGKKERKGLFDDDCDESDAGIFLDTPKRKSESSGSIGTTVGGQGRERKPISLGIALPIGALEDLDRAECLSSRHLS